ncbi:MAG TPA: phosphoadenylyl-sulfate reductase [Azospirillaceae bacterium]|nr:phosphoadenylyl-sulfate reductase [Azospirillaceae bacterium]HRQ80025.1 phosphoadenylyl-sulfate reductase [Azospirillaceae bacterium]
MRDLAALNPFDAQGARDAAFAAALNARYAAASPQQVLEAAIRDLFPGRLALVSSFGTEAAVLLALAADVDKSLPILFVDTRKLFGETLRYRDDLIDFLGLTDVRTVEPDRELLARRDPEDMLWHGDADACCHIRKTLPLAGALGGFDAWITGRKRFQSSTRAAIPLFEEQDGWIKVNPLATWSKADLENEFEKRGLPRHPLEADGFLSVGCYTCTERVAPGADPRSGRWAGKAKTECGIHIASLDGSSL